jgi:hypothetical protein
LVEIGESYRNFDFDLEEDGTVAAIRNARGGKVGRGGRQRGRGGQQQTARPWWTAADSEAVVDSGRQQGRGGQRQTARPW